MSSLLLSNPFVAPPPPASMAGYVSPSGGLAVAPTQGSSASAGADDNAGAGMQGRGDGSGQKAYMAMTRAASAIGRPADATPGSIISAQAQADTPGVIVPFGQNLPDFEMPDVLPTAPWFKDS